MYRLSESLFTIGDILRVSLNVIVEDSPTSSLKKKQPPINRFNMGTDKYLNINIHPYLQFDLSRWDDNKESSYNPATRCTLNKRACFELMMKASKMLKKMQETKNLYYYDEKNTLQIDKNEAMKLEISVITGNKMIKMIPVVVDIEGIKYEGAVIYINKVDVYAYLSYIDISFLISEIKKMNMHEMAMTLLTASMLIDNKGSARILPTRKVEEQVPPVMDDGKRGIVQKSNDNVLPDI